MMAQYTMMAQRPGRQAGRKENKQSHNCMTDVREAGGYSSVRMERNREPLHQSWDFVCETLRSTSAL